MIKLFVGSGGAAEYDRGNCRPIRTIAFLFDRVLCKKIDPSRLTSDTDLFTLAYRFFNEEEARFASRICVDNFYASFLEKREGIQWTVQHEY